MKLSWMILLSLLFISCDSKDTVRGPSIETLTLENFNSRTSPKWGVVLTDIIQHEAPGDSNNYNDLVTVAHETTHGINSYIRNKMNHTGTRANGFYVLNDKAVVVSEPNMMKHDVIPFVPASLRGDRFALYIQGSSDWDDTPLYVWDEWVSYSNGAIAAVDMYQNKLWTYGWRDAVAGEIEFVVYGIATVMAIQEKDPALSANKDFQTLFADNIKRSMDSFKIGKDIKEFAYATQDKYYENLKSSPDAEKLRQFVRDMFGSDWIYQVMGF